MVELFCVFKYIPAGWKTAAKKPVKNDDLWKELDALSHKHELQWIWVKGHAGHSENEKADTLANQGAARFLQPSS